MRCDVNISVREAGSDTLGARTEIKNMNSLRFITEAIEYETNRHITALETGCETLVQETRRWDENKGVTASMREKENAMEYRYFPNPEIMPVYIDDEWVASIKKGIPESAAEKYKRFTLLLGLPEYESKIITSSKNLSEIFDGTFRYFSKPREIANWIIVDLLSAAKGIDRGDEDIKIDCRKFAALMDLVDKKIINRNVGKKVLIKVLEEDADPVSYVEENRLGMVSDEGLIERTVEGVLSENPKSVGEYLSGNEKVFGFLVGKVMKKLEGKADPHAVNACLKESLAKAGGTSGRT